MTLQFFNDGKPFNLLEQLETVGQVKISCHPLVAKGIVLPIPDAKKISTWLHDICKRSTEEYILINNDLVHKNDIKLYTGDINV